MPSVWRTERRRFAAASLLRFAIILLILSTAIDGKGTPPAAEGSERSLSQSEAPRLSRVFAQRPNRNRWLGSNDFAVASAVASRLHEAKFRGFKPEVEARNGHVIIEGEVSSFGDWTNAVKIAYEVEGVENVENRVTIALTPPQLYQANNQRLAESVASALVQAGFRNADFVISADSGTVVLEGTVRSTTAHKRAIISVLRVPGVRKVGDLLRIVIREPVEAPKPT